MKYLCIGLLTLSTVTTYGMYRPKISTLPIRTSARPTMYLLKRMNSIQSNDINLTNLDKAINENDFNAFKQLILQSRPTSDQVSSVKELIDQRKQYLDNEKKISNSYLKNALLKGSVGLFGLSTSVPILVSTIEFCLNGSPCIGHYRSFLLMPGLCLGASFLMGGVFSILKATEDLEGYFDNKKIDGCFNEQLKKINKFTTFIDFVDEMNSKKPASDTKN